MQVECKFYLKSLRDPLNKTGSAHENSMKECFDIEDVISISQRKKLCCYYQTKLKTKHAKIRVVSSKDFINQEKKSYLFSGVDKAKTILIVPSFDQFEYILKEQKEFQIDYKILEEISNEVLDIRTTLDEIYQTKQALRFENSLKEYDYIKVLKGDSIRKELKDYSRFQETQIFRKLEEKVNDENFKGSMGQPGWEKLIPGSIRSNESFFWFVNRFMAGLHFLLSNNESRLFSLKDIIELLEENFKISLNSLKFAPLRFKIMRKRIQRKTEKSYLALRTLFQIGEIISSQISEFKVLVEPSFDPNTKRSPVITFFRIDDYKLLDQLFSGYSRVLLGSFCLGRPNQIIRKLSRKPDDCRITRIYNPFAGFRIFPFYKHSDQTIFRTEWKERSNSTMNKHFGNLLVSLSGDAPDGMIVVFPDYQYIEQLISEWSKLGIIDGLCKHKLVFIDSRERAQNRLIYNAYRDAISKGRGAVLFTNYNSSFLKGLNLTRALCKTCVFFGIPYDIQTAKVCWIQQKQLQRNYQVNVQQLMEMELFKKYFQFMNECLENGDDTCCFVIADIRFSNQRIRQMPEWMLRYTECNELFDKQPLLKQVMEDSDSQGLYTNGQENSGMEGLPRDSKNDHQEHWGFEISEGLKKIKSFFLNFT